MIARVIVRIAAADCSSSSKVTVTGERGTYSVAEN
jgi:hypothetical protein